MLTVLGGDRDSHVVTEGEAGRDATKAVVVTLAGGVTSTLTWPLESVRRLNV